MHNINSAVEIPMDEQRTETVVLKSFAKTVTKTPAYSDEARKSFEEDDENSYRSDDLSRSEALSDDFQTPSASLQNLFTLSQEKELDLLDEEENVVEINSDLEINTEVKDQFKGRDECRVVDTELLKLNERKHPSSLSLNDVTEIKVDPATLLHCQIDQKSVSPIESPCSISPGNISGSSDFTQSLELNLSKDSNSSTSSGNNTIVASTNKSKDKEPLTVQPGTQATKPGKKKMWYHVFTPSYKTRSTDFRKYFKDLPPEERLIVDYSCALQKEILVQGRMFISQNFVSFYANIFGWQTTITIKFKDVSTITKENTALVIPNAVQMTVAKDKYFFTSLVNRDATYLMLFKLWQTALLDQAMPPKEIWKLVHSCYGEVEIDSEEDAECTEDYISMTAASSLVTAIDSRSILQSVREIETQQTSFTGQLQKFAADTVTTTTVNMSSEALSSSGKNSVNDDTVSPCFLCGVAKKTLPLSEWVKALSENTSAEAELNKGSSGNLNFPSLITDRTGLLPEIDNDSATPRIDVASLANETGNVDLTGTDQHTDLSDSSDSEEELVVDEPISVTIPVCPVPHDDGKTVVDTIIPCDVNTLFTMLFTNSKFYLEFHTMRKTFDILSQEWQDKDGKTTRQVSFTVTLNQRMGPKHTQITESQTLLPGSKPGYFYAVDVESNNAGIPYADAFYVTCHFCLSRAAANQSRLIIVAQVRYRKSIWGLTKSFIEKNSWAGIDEFYSSLERSLKEECATTGVAVSPPPSPRGKPAVRRRPLRKKGPAPGIPIGIPVSPNVDANTPLVTMIGDRSRTVAETKSLSLENGIILKVILTVLASLLVLNGFLYIKLTRLETSTGSPIFFATPPVFNRESPLTHQEWLDLLQRQEALHRFELQKWHDILLSALKILKQAETDLESLKHHLNSYMFSQIHDANYMKPENATKHSDDQKHSVSPAPPHQEVGAIA